MTTLRHYLRRARELGPKAALGRAAGRAQRVLERMHADSRDRASRTYANGPLPGPLATFLPAPDPAALAPHREMLEALSHHYLAHRFDLLGSGWTRVAYGIASRGLEGIAFPAGPTVAIDRAGNWLSGRLSDANLEEARRVWALVDEPYTPIDWQLDFKSGYRWDATTLSSRVRPSGSPRGADIKVPWELARGQHLPQLALAFAASGDARLPREARNQILDFIATNPPRFGVNWVCAMDIAIRVANWLLARDLFRAAGAAVDDEFEAVLARSVLEHAQHVADHLEWHEALRGNHYLADVCGLLFASAYLPATANSDAWLGLALQELLGETRLQFYDEGTNCEASTCYHRLCAELVVHAAALALGIPEHRARRLSRLAPRPFDSGPRLVGPPPCLRDLDGALRVALPEWFGTRLERMAEFTLCIASRNGTVPQIGDNDSGRLFKLPGTYRVTTAAEARRRYRTLEGWNELADEEACPEEQGLDHRHLVGAVNGLVPRADFASFARGFELDAWLVRALAGRTLSPRGAAERAHGAIGEAAAVERTLAEIRGLPGTHRQTYRFAGSHLRQRLETFAYPAFGLYVWCSPTLHLVVRCGPSGPKVQGAHAHNDALGITLAIGGRELVADPGSYVYTPLPNARNRYRSAAAHFVPRVAGREPAPLDRGLFVLPDTPGATCIRFGPEGFAGAHSGFGPPVLRVIRIEEDSVTIEDGSLGEPLERCEAPAPVAVSDKYGWLRR